MLTKRMTFAQLRDLLNNLYQIGNIQSPSNQMEYAAHKFLKRGEAIWKGYTEAVEDINQDYCAVDEKGFAILNEKGGIQFTKEGLRLRLGALRELDKRSIEIELYLCKNEILIDALPLHIKELYAGFLFAWSEEEFEQSFNTELVNER